MRRFLIVLAVLVALMPSAVMAGDPPKPEPTPVVITAKPPSYSFRVIVVRPVRWGFSWKRGWYRY